ncbi:MAG: hypothetical protein AMXMBFR64_36790 [Myxococcales bacterium]
MTTTSAAGPPPHEPWPIPDPSVPQLTVRAIMTGMVLGATLSLCNIYAGLKIGWGFNMSITAALLSYGFWQALHFGAGLRSWNILENNVNQTAASAAASISSAGLVAPIPAWTILTGETLSWTALVIWTFSVSLVGIAVAVALRRQMLLVDELPFPGGIATGETLKEMYAKGKEAMARVYTLLSGAAVGVALKISVTVWSLPKLSVPVSFKAGSVTVTPMNLGLALDPSVLMVGLGALIGMRACWSLLLGALVTWGVLAPDLLARGWAQPGKPEAEWFGSIVGWLVWPGVVLLVTSSLTSFLFSWRSVVRALTGGRGGGSSAEDHDVPRQWLGAGIIVALVFSVVCQMAFFSISPLVATLGVILTFVLALVAARVSGETGVTPVGAMGKVTQLTFGAISPGNVTDNLMTANVTGGAASQCADLLHDMKTGLMIGASPRYQAIAQVAGCLAGALAGSAAYLLLIPDPQGMLLTPEWAAPAVLQWKAVAEVLTKGFSHLPPGVGMAMVWGAGLGIGLAVLEKVVPPKVRAWVPSPAALGLAIVVPAHNSISIFLGGLLALIAFRVHASWAQRFVVVLAAGLIAGESLTGIGVALQKMLAG